MKKYFIFLFIFIATIGFTQVSIPTNLSVKGIADWVRNFEFVPQSVDNVMPEVPTKRGIQYIKWSDLAYPEHYVSNGSSWVLMNGRIFNQGTAEKPGIVFKNDELTGLFNADLNTIGFSTGAVERMRLNAQGRLLLGSAFDNGIHRLQVTGDTKLSGNLLVTGTIVGAIESVGILGRGDGLLGNDFNGTQSTLWSLDFGTSSVQAARGNHTHALLTRGAGLTGNNYNGSTATTWAIAFGSTAGTSCEGNDSRLSDARIPVSHTLLSHSASGLTANQYLKALSATTYGFSAIALTDLGLSSNLSVVELNYSDGLTDNIQTQLNGKSSTSHTHTFGTSAGTFAEGNDSRFGQVKTSVPASPVNGDIWIE